MAYSGLQQWTGWKLLTNFGSMSEIILRAFFPSPFFTYCYDIILAKYGNVFDRNKTAIFTCRDAVANSPVLKGLLDLLNSSHL